MSSNTDNRLPPASPAEAGAFVSVDLTARVAGVSRNDMQRIAAEFDKGRTEPWYGGILEVRRSRVLGRKHREIRIASLPEPFRWALTTDRFRFRLAAEQVEHGAELTPADFMLLHRAAQADFGAPGLVGLMVERMCAGGSMLDASREMYERAIDNLYGYGFRDDALPGVAADYRAWLDDCRRQLGMGDRHWEALLIEVAGVEMPERLDGQGFILVAQRLTQLGVPWTLPRRDFVNHEAIGILHEARRQLGLSYDDHMRIVTGIGGGAPRTRHLDQSGWIRVRAFYLKHGYRAPEPAPRVPGAPGFITQGQAALIWRLWRERGGDGESTSSEALDQWLGFAGGLTTLTAAGAGRVIDEFGPDRAA